MLNSWKHTSVLLMGLVLVASAAAYGGTPEPVATVPTANGYSILKVK